MMLREIVKSLARIDFESIFLAKGLHIRGIGVDSSVRGQHTLSTLSFYASASGGRELRATVAFDWREWVMNRGLSFEELLTVRVEGAAADMAEKAAPREKEAVA